MPDEKGIYKALAAVNRAITKIAKEQKNEQQGWMFRGIDDVMNTLHPLFAEQGIIVVQRDISLERETFQRAGKAPLFLSTLTTEWDYVAEDGSKVIHRTITQGMDSSDKGPTKAASIGLKYDVLRMFFAPTAEQVDGDGETLEVFPAEPVHATEVQLETIRTLAEETGKSLERLCEHYGVQSLGHLSGVDANDAIAVMRRLSSTKKAVDKSVAKPNGG